MQHRKIKGIDIYFDNNVITIIDSWKIEDQKQMETILNIVRYVADRHYGCTYKRTNKSWIQEWTSHNLLYKFSLFTNHTKDTDLDEHESKFRLFIYKFLGM